MKYIILMIALLFVPTLNTQTFQSQYVFLITLDGLRWQEVFSGADGTLIGDDEFVIEPESLKQKYWADEPYTRRSLLMPFFWTVIAKDGRLYGNRLHGNHVNVKNKHRFSYPGYNEILTGFADDRIDSNDKLPNQNVTVLEYINNLPRFRNSVAAFASWDVFPYIINEKRSGVPVNAGFEAATGDELTDRERYLNTLQTQIPSPWSTVRLDAFTHHYALEYIKKHVPRLLYISYGETDDFAHDGRYDAYLEAAHNTDSLIEGLWHWVQSHEPYRNRTTFIITTDHGRGTQPKESWKDHGASIDGSDEIWFAVIGPDITPRGEVTSPGQYYQTQFARTVAAFLGEAYLNQQKSGGILSEVINK